MHDDGFTTLSVVGRHVGRVLLVHLIHISLIDVRRNVLSWHAIVRRLVHVHQVGSLAEARRLSTERNGRDLR